MKYPIKYITSFRPVIIFLNNKIFRFVIYFLLNRNKFIILIAFNSFLTKLNIRIINILNLELTTIINIIIIRYISFDYLRVLFKKKIFSRSYK